MPWVFNYLILLNHSFKSLLHLIPRLLAVFYNLIGVSNEELQFLEYCKSEQSLLVWFVTIQNSRRSGKSLGIFWIKSWINQFETLSNLLWEVPLDLCSTILIKQLRLTVPSCPALKRLISAYQFVLSALPGRDRLRSVQVSGIRIVDMVVTDSFQWMSIKSWDMNALFHMNIQNKRGIRIIRLLTISRPFQGMNGLKNWCIQSGLIPSSLQSGGVLIPASQMGCFSFQAGAWPQYGYRRAPGEAFRFVENQLVLPSLKSPH